MTDPPGSILWKMITVCFTIADFHMFVHGFSNIFYSIETKNAFQIVGIDNTTTFICASPEEKAKWTTSLQPVIEESVQRNPTGICFLQ